ncbi:4'-phosphopantetheinyl transferase superfamily protein [Streptomyces flavotricini]|uniref:4'-phosphopantetheinyl transferase superfamily protein n=1 Tax=Streptomyces flavotricini TaxID=66888 RepID=A0ABS8DZP2_9ACTN|nr:4'-phosphopantetheinyl transferase superfamily protein [Streptomyces flavotricini]MCC0093864.1 4'-phosphopantetheinyl transferase superfamily protein [Streptomyces flavotricini]
MTWHNSPLLSVPVHAAGPGGPWAEVAAGMTRGGNACVYTTWQEWPAEPGSATALRILLGRDWARYRDTADATTRHRFLASRLAIRYTAAAALGCGPAELDLSYKPGGRPYLRGFDQIDLSLTHTDDLIAVGISRNGRIGVDTEPADRRLSFELLQDQVCTAAERAELAALGERGQNAGMLRLWTLKEAYTKALGLGLRMGFAEFGFATATGGETGLLTPDGSPATHGEWAFGTYPVAGRYLLSVACHDAGLDTSRDSSVTTMLDEGFVGMVSALLDPALPGPA